MKKVLLAVLLLCLIAATAQATTLQEYIAQDTEFTLWHRLDGSTATIPLSRAIAKHFLNLTESELDVVIHHYKTSSAYENLAEGEKDLIFVTEPYEGDEDMPEFDVIPISYDALVFVNHVKNPVDNVTVEQLRDIYLGNIKNWSEVGGNDTAIFAYQRPLYSGSQTLFLQRLMEGQAPMEPVKEWVVSSMGDLIDAVASYVNADNSLGYTVYYYLNNMYKSPDLRMLKVNGVLPTNETLVSGEYPLQTFYYAVLRADTPADHPARLLVEWLLGEEGQMVSASVGYLPIAQ